MDRASSPHGEAVHPWAPPVSFEERLRLALVPPRLALFWDLAWERRRGEAEIHLVRRLADPGRTSIDVGANRGVWTEAMRRHSRDVLAFEPNPKMFRDLARRLGPGARALPLALSDRNGDAELRVPRRRRGYSNQGATLAHASLGACPFGSLLVQTRRLDDIETGDVGLIKIDVEGHELAVLRGAAALLARCRPALIIEIEEKHHRRPIAGAIAEVCSYGYEAHCLRAGRLLPVRGIDLARHNGPAARREDYVFNWVFLPRCGARPALAESRPPE